MSIEAIEGVMWCTTHNEPIDEVNDNRCRARDFTSTPCLWVPLYTTPIGGEVEILDWYVNQLTEALNVLHFCDDRMDSFAFSELSSVLDDGGRTEVVVHVESSQREADVDVRFVRVSPDGIRTEDVLFLDNLLAQRLVSDRERANTQRDHTSSMVEFVVEMLDQHQRRALYEWLGDNPYPGDA